MTKKQRPRVVSMRICSATKKKDTTSFVVLATVSGERDRRWRFEVGDHLANAQVLARYLVSNILRDTNIRLNNQWDMVNKVAGNMLDIRARMLAVS